MGQIFGSIYCWLEDFFGLELADYLWGVATDKQTTNMFIGIGLAMLGVSLAVAVCFYYVVNHPRLNNWWGGGIFLLANAALNFVVGWQWVLRDYYAGLMVTTDPATGQEVALPINGTNLLNFGITNMVDSIVAFILFSYIIKWWSTNCPRAPF